jgi:hypothetical protein
LAAVASGGAGLALANVDPAGAQATAAPPAPVVTSTPSPSFGAAAFAATMRGRFDAHLTQADLDAIARGVDVNAKTAAASRSGKKRLSNSDAPAVRFRVAGDEA